MKIVGKVKSVYHRSYVYANTPFRTYYLVVVYQANVYSHKKKIYYNSDKELVLQHTTTNYQKGDVDMPFSDDLSEKMYDLSQISSNDIVYVGVDFYMESMENNYTTKDGDEVRNYRTKLKINNIISMGMEPDLDYVDEDMTQDIPNLKDDGSDDLPF